MGQGALIDSNVIIDYIGDIVSNPGKSFIKKHIDLEFNISVIVKIEVLGYNDLPEKLIILEEFLSLSNVYQLTDAVTEKTIQLRRSYRGLKLGDALIAATALVNNFVLITRNTKDFHQIIGLKVINPYDL